jgi:hypothetical protein
MALNAYSSIELGGEPVAVDIADQYRQKADECLAAADRAQDQTERIELLGIAHGYLRLAMHVTTKKKQEPADDAVDASAGP